MDLQNILEGIISGLIATAISGFIVFLYSKSKGKNKLMVGKSHKKFDISKINAFAVFLFITSFFAVISAFGFYYEWEKFPYLIFITILLGFLTAFIYNNQCPKCKKIFVRNTHEPEIIKEEKRKHTHVPSTTYLYSDGTFKNRKVNNRKEKIMETVRTQRDNFSCRSCGHKWKSSAYERNLDAKNRPRSNIVRTRHKNPDDSIF